MGSTGSSRSSACIADFSSTQKTAACVGGFRYKPMIAAAFFSNRDHRWPYNVPAYAAGSGSSPDSVNCILADAQMLGQLAARPMGRTIHWLPASCLQYLGLQLGRDHGWLLARMSNQSKTRDPLLFKSRFPQRDRRSCCFEPFLNLAVRSPLRQH